MIEVWIFGALVATLASALSVVLVLVALTSITYLAVTLAPALRSGDAGADRAARRIGTSIAAAALLCAAIGLRVGAPGAGGEIIPTLALAVAASAALGSAAASAALGGGRALAALGAARSRRSRAIEGEKRERARQLGESRRAFLEADDLRVELAEAVAAVARLSGALGNLAATHAEVEARLARLEGESAEGDLARELRRTRDEVATKLELGDKILKAARASAMRIAVNAPLARLFRQRPRDLAAGLSAPGGVNPREVDAIAEALDAFLGRAAAARAELAEIDASRAGEAVEDDPLPQAKRDVDAVEAAYRTVRERLDVVRMRIAARADLDTVARAAGEVSEKARASGLPAEELQDLVAEVMRAEAAIVMATPTDLDARALTATLARGTDALGGRDGASLDELLRALREIA